VSRTSEDRPLQIVTAGVDSPTVPPGFVEGDAGGSR
jgi:hypothetical protein